MYRSAVVQETAARAGLPYTAAALASALAEELAAVYQLEVAGFTCATSLAFIEADIASAEFPILGQIRDAAVDAAVQTATFIEHANHYKSPIEGFFGSALHKLDHDIEHYKTTYTRLGQEFERWLPNTGKNLPEAFR